MPHAAAMCWILLVFLPFGVDGAVLASSKLEHCTNDGTQLEPQNCAEKLVVSITVGSQQDATEELVISKTVDRTGVNRTLSDPVKVRISKSTSMFRYPLTYVQDFNANPHETVSHTSLLQCRDDSSDVEPTCGWHMDSQGQPIPYSQGFCCRCPASELLNFFDPADSRGQVDCSLFGKAASAHCLDWGDDWYSAFAVGPARTWYSITVSLEAPGLPPRTVHLGPDNTGANTGDAVMTLVGDFATFQQPENLEDKFLLVPSWPEWSARVKNGKAEWMLLDRVLFTLDGLACDKIGVSHSAFFAQAQRCTMKAGSCLQSQIDDYREADLKKVQKGLMADHLIQHSKRSALGMYQMQNTTAHTTALRAKSRRGRTLSAADTTALFLAYKIVQKQTSVLTLTFKADSLRYIQHVADGQILDVKVTDFQGMSDEGLLAVRVRSSGSIAAEFFVALHCSAAVAAVPEQQRTLAGGQAETFKFDVRVPTMQAKAHTCVVVLRNALFQEVDNRTVAFGTMDTNKTSGAQAGHNTQDPGNSATSLGGTQKQVGCTACPFYNPLCFLSSRCFTQLLVQAGTVLGAIAVVVIFLRCGGASCCRGLCRCLCRRPCPHKRPPQDQRSPPRSPPRSLTASPDACAPPQPMPYACLPPPSGKAWHYSLAASPHVASAQPKGGLLQADPLQAHGFTDLRLALVPEESTGVGQGLQWRYT